MQLHLLAFAERGEKLARIERSQPEKKTRGMSARNPGFKIQKRYYGKDVALGMQTPSHPSLLCNIELRHNGLCDHLPTPEQTKIGGGSLYDADLHRYLVQLNVISPWEHDAQLHRIVFVFVLFFC